MIRMYGVHRCSIADEAQAIVDSNESLNQEKGNSHLALFDALNNAKEFYFEINSIIQTYLEKEEDHEETIEQLQEIHKKYLGKTEGEFQKLRDSINKAYNAFKTMEHNSDLIIAELIERHKEYEISNGINVHVDEEGEYYVGKY